MNIYLFTEKYTFGSLIYHTGILLNEIKLLLKFLHGLNGWQYKYSWALCKKISIGENMISTY